MDLDPPLARLAEALVTAAASAPGPQTHAERRAAADATMLLIKPARPEGTEVTDHRVPVEGGEVTVRVIRPPGLVDPAPAFFFLHGGGWFQGTIDTGEVECGLVYETAGCVVVSVEYRLAPENPFPMPLEDCASGYRWLHDHAESLGIDTSRVAVGGTSAGANLAAALCLVIRDRGWPMPILQLLDAPCLDLTLSSPSMKEYDEGAGLTREAVDEYAGFYCGKTPRTHPRISPLHEPDLSGLPPAVVIVAEHDPVRDDGERYVARLWEAGVAGSCTRVVGHFHVGWMVPITLTHRLVNDLRANALRRAFAGDLRP